MFHMAWKVIFIVHLLKGNSFYKKKSVYFHCHTPGKIPKEKVNHMKKYSMCFNLDYYFEDCPLASYF